MNIVYRLEGVYGAGGVCKTRKRNATHRVKVVKVGNLGMCRAAHWARFGACGDWKLWTCAVAVLIGAGCANAAEISSNGTGGGPWSNPATWRGKVVPGPGDDVVIQKFDVVAFDRNDDGKVSCRKLQIDPKGSFVFKTGAGKLVCCVAAGIDSFGAIKIDGTKSAGDFFELRMIGDAADKRKIKLNKNAALLLYGKANLAENKRNVALTSPKLTDQKDDILSLIEADGGVSIDWQRAILHDVKLQAQKLDNTGAKGNERLNLIGNQFVGKARIWLHTCDSPVIARNSFEYADKAPLNEAAVAVYYGPLAEIKLNTIRGPFSHGIIIGYQSDTAIESNTIEGAAVGIQGGYGIPNTMIKNCQVKGCDAGIKLEGASGVIEDTVVAGAATAFHHENANLQLTNLQIKDLKAKGIAVNFLTGKLTLLNCNIVPADIKIGAQPAAAKETPVTCLQYAIIAVKDAPADALVDVRTIDPKLPADVADTNVRNSPAPLVKGLTPLPRTLNPLTVKSWHIDLAGKLQAAPEYTVKVLGPAAKEGDARPVLKTTTFRPMEKAYRATLDDATPTLEVNVK